MPGTDPNQDQHFMKLAIQAARTGIEQDQTPFGACIVKDGKLVAVAHNAVWEQGDATAHAEITAIREACHKLGTIDLSGTTIYSTCEPCPMCFAACHWAKISRIVFGARIADAQAAGFNELPVSNQVLKNISRVPLELTPDLLRDECYQLFQEWARRPQRKVY